MQVFERIIELILSGGFVGVPLAVLTFVMWIALSYRYFLLKSIQTTDFVSELESLDRRDLRNQADVVLSEWKSRLSEKNTLVSVIVVIAPLLGLLGTVDGMIETFESLGDMNLFSQSGGIAGGISSALISTQMGLCVAIPGLIAMRLLFGKQKTISAQLEIKRDTFLQRQSLGGLSLPKEEA